MRTGPTNTTTVELIASLRKESSVSKAALWSRIADDLEKPTRQRRVVNLSRLTRYTNANEVVIVPGKVLGSGVLGHNVTVAALAFSGGAKERIESAKGKALTITELLKQKPDVKKIRIIG
jgi:large subunit ribosomal protein L18e